MLTIQQVTRFDEPTKAKKSSIPKLKYFCQRSCLPNRKIGCKRISTTRFQKLRISVKAYEPNNLDTVCELIVNAIKDCDMEPVGPIALPRKLRRYCVLTSPHVNKKARDHFEIRIHKRIIDIIRPTDSVLENLKRLNISATRK